MFFPPSQRDTLATWTRGIRTTEGLQVSIRLLFSTKTIVTLSSLPVHTPHEGPDSGYRLPSLPAPMNGRRRDRLRGWARKHPGPGTRPTGRTQYLQCPPSIAPITRLFVRGHWVHLLWMSSRSPSLRPKQCDKYRCLFRILPAHLSSAPASW